MAIPKKKIIEILENISEKYDIPIDDLYKMAPQVNVPSPFASKKAKDYAEESGVEYEKLKLNVEAGQLKLRLIV